MKEKAHMSFWGIGPLFVILSLSITLPVGYLAYQYRTRFTLAFAPVLFYITGLLVLLIGVCFWVIAGSQVDDYIREGTLADKGLYGIVRHPIYFGIYFVFTGILICTRSVILIPLIPIIYLVLALLLRREEQTLYMVFGERFEAYKRAVNLIIPKPQSLAVAFFYPEKTRNAFEGLYIIKSRDVNLYVYTDGKDVICIDAGYDDPGIVAEFNTVGLDIDRVSAVFLTHSDIDHLGGLDLFQSAEIYLGRDEEDLVEQSRGRFFNIYKNKRIHRPYHLLGENDVVKTGNIEVEAIETPGHTIGHMSYLVAGKYLFTGDAVLLQNGVLKPFYRILSMDHKATIASAEKIKRIQSIQWICTGHTGIGRARDYLR
ncbi:MAG: MBL fold metallo-hydrolase [Anaerolineae bacterium]|nr:MBL fold metallo-hydrolase [Anaerolineae bacterium]